MLFVLHLYWSIIALQWCVSFCCITKWISSTYTHIPIATPSCVSLPPSLSHPSRWSQSTELISLCYAAAAGRFLTTVPPGKPQNEILYSPIRLLKNEKNLTISITGKDGDTDTWKTVWYYLVKLNKKVCLFKVNWATQPVWCVLMSTKFSDKAPEAFTLFFGYMSIQAKWNGDLKWLSGDIRIQQVNWFFKADF